jgi:hypothetical protein
MVMNILYISHALGKRRLSTAVDASSGVNYGRTILIQINANLPHDIQITTDPTGEELASFFLALFPELRATLLGIELLTTTQAMAFNSVLKRLDAVNVQSEAATERHLNWIGIGISSVTILVMVLLTLNYLIVAPSYGLTIDRDLLRDGRLFVEWLFGMFIKK